MKRTPSPFKLHTASRWNGKRPSRTKTYAHSHALIAYALIAYTHSCKCTRTSTTYTVHHPHNVHALPYHTTILHAYPPSLHKRTHMLPSSFMYSHIFFYSIQRKEEGNQKVNPHHISVFTTIQLSIYIYTHYTVMYILTRTCTHQYPLSH